MWLVSWYTLGPMYSKLYVAKYSKCVARFFELAKNYQFFQTCSKKGHETQFLHKNLCVAKFFWLKSVSSTKKLWSFGAALGYTLLIVFCIDIPRKPAPGIDPRKCLVEFECVLAIQILQLGLCEIVHQTQFSTGIKFFYKKALHMIF